MTNPDTSDTTDVAHTNIAPSPIPFGSDSCDKLAVYFDELKFIPSLSQGNFIFQIKTYSFNGVAVTDIVVGCHYDGPTGGGWQAVGEQFGFFNDYSADDESRMVTYSNRLYTTVQLGGLDLPFGVKFDDALALVLQKFGIDLDLESDFAWDEDHKGRLILYGDERSLLQLFNYNLSAEGSPNSKYDCELRYTEISQCTLADGRIADVTREINLFFSDMNSNLSCFEMSVKEVYPLMAYNDGE